MAKFGYKKCNALYEFDSFRGKRNAMASTRLGLNVLSNEIAPSNKFMTEVNQMVGAEN